MSLGLDDIATTRSGVAGRWRRVLGPFPGSRVKGGAKWAEKQILLMNKIRSPDRPARIKVLTTLQREIRGTVPAALCPSKFPHGLSQD